MARTRVAANWRVKVRFLANASTFEWSGVGKNWL